MKMTQKEIAMKIIKDGNCSGVMCRADNCPLVDKSCGTGVGTLGMVVEWAKEWLESNGGTMNKLEALSRLDAIEKEQAELRKIIEKGEKNDNLVFDRDVIYIALYNGNPYYMAGGKDAGFCFYRILDTETSYSKPRTTGQECLDYHAEAGFDIHVFNDTKEALQFFIDHL